MISFKRIKGIKKEFLYKNCIKIKFKSLYLPIFLHEFYEFFPSNVILFFIIVSSYMLQYYRKSNNQFINIQILQQHIPVPGMFQNSCQIPETIATIIEMAYLPNLFETLRHARY